MADCHSDGISIDAGDAVSQTVTALRFATIVPGAYCWHHADDNELLDLCRKERRVELAFENHRFFDTRTWKIAEECDGGKMWGMNVETTGSGDVTPDSFWERTVFEKRVFKKQHYLYPFTQTEISLNKQLTQNYGW